MRNSKVMDLFDQLGDTRIDQMFWIATNPTNSDLHWFLSQIPDERIVELFPKLKSDGYLKDLIYLEDWETFLFDNEYFGFIAEVHIPHINNVTFKNDVPKHWSASLGLCSVHYCYGETTDELVAEIEKLYQSRFNDMIESARKEARNV